MLLCPVWVSWFDEVAPPLQGYQSHTLAVSRHVRAEVRVHEHVGAFPVDGHTWAAGSEPMDVAHGIVTLDVWDVAQER